MGTTEMTKSSLNISSATDKQTYKQLAVRQLNLPTEVAFPPLHQAAGFCCNMLGTVQHLDQVQSL